MSRRAQRSHTGGGRAGRSPRVGNRKLTSHVHDVRFLQYVSVNVTLKKQESVVVMSVASRAKPKREIERVHAPEARNTGIAGQGRVLSWAEQNGHDMDFAHLPYVKGRSP